MSKKGIGGWGDTRIRSRDIREICVSKASLLESLGKSTLRWAGHMERMNEWKLTERIHKQDVDRVRMGLKKMERWD